VELGATTGIVEKIARDAGRGVQRVEIHDPNISDGRAIFDPQTGALLPAGVFTVSTTLAIGPSLRVLGSEDTVAIECETSGNEAVFSVNRADRLLPTVAIPAEYDDIQVFLPGGEQASAAARWLASPENCSSIRKLALRQTDSVHIYANNIIAYLRRPDLDRVMRTTYRLVGIAKRLSAETDAGGSRMSQLPGALFELHAHLEWSISDDDIRAARLAAADESDLRRLRDGVWQYLPAINEFLGSPDALIKTDVAAQLDALAQAAIEAAQVLQARKE
jgi:hypothetical protein